MATPKRMKPYRSWSSVDSVDPNDVHRLCDSEIGEGGQKPSIPGGRCISTWTFSLVVLIISVFLLVGLFVGYYIRDGQNYSASDHPVCDYTFRTDGYGPERLEMVHENLMYLMSGQRITDTAGKMAAVSIQKSGETSDEKMVNYVHENLKNLGLDKVETIKYQAEVISLDPENPSTITLSKAGKEKLVLKPGESGPSAKEEGGERGGETPTVAVPGRGTGHLVYGFYGRKQDLFYVKKSNITLKNCVLLLKIGETSLLEKVRLASLESVSGVLLYRDPSDSPVSWGELEYISNKLADGNFHIPVLLISNHESDQLLRELQDEGVASPEDWTDANGARPYMGIVSSNSTSPVVNMKVNVIQREETITNVIGSIYGDMEPDRFVVIGAVRDMTSTGNLDLGLGTAHLIEMAQSFVNIKFAEKWGPRRGVRFCSWGGGKSLRGLSEHLKMNKYVFGEQTLAYIDLDLYIQRTSTDKTIFEVSSSPALQMLVQHVLHQVPHPQDKQFTIADWQYDRSYNQFVTHGNQIIRDTLQNQGILVVSVGYMVNQNKDNEDSAVLHDALHHDQYHLAASRVLSLISLNLMDNNHLPLNLLNYTKFIHDVFGRSLVDLSKAEAVVDRELLSKTIDQLLRIGKAFEDFVNSKDFTRIPMGSRRMNDIKMGVDKIMTSPQKLRHISPLLYGTAPDGSSLLLKEAIKTANITKDWKDVQSIVNAIVRAIEEVMSYLQLS